MAVKTPFSIQDFKHILTHYTSQGKFIFRYYENRSIGSVLFESELLLYLREHRYPCPSPCQNKNGAYVGLYHGKPYLLMHFINGQHIEDPQDHHKQQLIQKVAELQVMTQAFQPRYLDYRWNYDIELCRRLARVEAQKINSPNAYEKLSWLENQLSVLDLPDSLPKGICHCDFHFSNVLFQDDQFVGLLDFDDANFTYLVFDLVCLIDSWAWPFQSEALDLVNAREIVQTYIRYRPLSDIEQCHIFEVHKLSILFDCIWYFGRGGADDFYEKRKIKFLNNLSWKKYNEAIFLA